MKGAQDRLGRRRATRAEMPLQIADPQHQLGDGGGAGVDLDAEELARIDGMSFERGKTLLSAEGGQRLQHFAFEPFHQFERDVKEVAGTAGGVEHADLAQAGVEGGDTGCGLVVAAFFLLPLSGREGLVPFRAQRLQHCCHDKAFDIGARGVMGAKASALCRVERLFEQGAEDRGFDLAPIGLGGGQQRADFLAAEFADMTVLEELAIEALDLSLQGEGIAALVHRLPELRDQGLKFIRLVLAFAQQVAEGFLRQQFDILGEHGEQAAHQEHGHVIGVGSGRFQRLRDGGQTPGDRARHLR